MKKKILLSAAILAAFCVFSFTACGDTTPEHTTHHWSATYTEDGDRHYQTCDGCDEKKYSSHEYGAGGVCVCGKQKPDTTVAVTDVSLNQSELTLEIGGTATLTATVAPENATDKSVTWESDKENIATVDNSGKVTAIKDGTAVITATTANGKTATCSVTVNAAVISVESVSLNKEEITLEIGGTETLTATVSPESATDKTVTWTSDKENIATVDNTGKVTAVAAGTAIITAKTANGKTATCSVTVNAPITNAQVLKYLNDNVLMKAVKDLVENAGGSFSEANVDNVSWFIIKNGKNIASTNLLFSYRLNDTLTALNLYRIDFASQLTYQDIKNNKISTLSYTKIYDNAYTSTIQEQHTALTNAICNKLFGENQNATRYIIDNGNNSMDDLGNVSRFTVIEITDTGIKENNIKIVYANSDDGLIANLNDTTKNKTYGDAKNVAITGDKLENNNEPFFG